MRIAPPPFRERRVHNQALRIAAPSHRMMRSMQPMIVAYLDDDESSSR
jgi:hypothetical protein